MVFKIPGFGRLTRQVRGDTAQVTIDARGGPRRQRPVLRIPIGYTDDTTHTPCYIDLTEPGTHGLLVGTDGSGRTHLLRSIVTAATDIYTSAELIVVAVDLSRHDDFAGLTDHTSTLTTSRALTVVTTPDPSHSLTHLFRQAVRFEVGGRSQQLREAAQQLDREVPDLATYNAIRASGQALPAIPALLIVVAEFQRGDTDESTIIAELDHALAIGRSLGIDFLFATSTLTGRAATALTSRLGYRIALRTNTIQESNTVIGRSDAAEIPVERAGVGFLRVGDSPPIRFRTPTLEVTQ
jgi:S-DNA-T family DNA segregation ATPase FtsK/SpoIIIE